MPRAPKDAKGVPITSTYEYQADRSFAALAKEGIDDLVDGARLHRTWISLGWRDLKNQTHRTLLGPLWSIVGTGIQIAALGYVYGALLKSNASEGYPYIAAGLILWFFISGNVLGGLTVFQTAIGVLQERALPVSFTIYRYVYRLFLELCVKFMVFLIVAALVRLPYGWPMLLVPVSLAIYVLNGFGSRFSLASQARAFVICGNSWHRSCCWPFLPRR